MKLVTWNAKGLCATDPRMWKKKMRHLKKLTSKRAIIMIQETHHSKERLDRTKHEFRDYMFFDSLPTTTGAGGVITMMEKTLVAEADDDVEIVEV